MVNLIICIIYYINLIKTLGLLPCHYANQTKSLLLLSCPSPSCATRSLFAPPPHHTHTHIPTHTNSRDEGANLPKHPHLPDLGLQGAAAWHWRACVLQRCM